MTPQNAEFEVDLQVNAAEHQQEVQHNMTLQNAEFYLLHGIRKRNRRSSAREV